MGLSFNYPFELGDSNGAIKSDIAQLEQNIGDLSQLETADKSSLVNALNEAIDSTLNGVDRDLSNLSDLGNDKLRSLNSYANYGELLTDADGLSFVQKYAHSTFDRSKFTVAGSPTITKNGILSVSSGSDYLETNETFDFSNGNMECSIDIDTITNFSNSIGTFAFSNSTIGWGSPALWLYHNWGSWYVKINDGTNNVVTPARTSYINGILKLSLYIKNNKIGGSITGTSVVSIDEADISSIDLTKLTNLKLRVGVGSSSWSAKYIRSLDMKTLSVLVDDKEIFNSRKEGMDILKADDYTEVNSPVISNDGIMTLDGASYNYVTTPTTIPLSTANAWKIVTPVFTLEANGSSNRSIIGANSNQDGLDIFVRNTGAIAWSILATINDQSSKIVGKTLLTPLLLNDGTKYQLAIEFTGTAYDLLLSINGGVFTQIDTVASTTKVTYNPTLYIGYRGGIEGKGTMDLNTMHVYVNGELIYQPCLKIPYKESKTGSKIVDSIYRDRVNDMAEQFGYANYYTLSDTDFTLPQIELYGLIGQRTLRDSYRNGATYWELWSDRTLEIGGTCTSGVEYNLPKSFTSENDYILSVPYSAKTASSFTPTASGDFIAKGLGVL